MGRKRDKGVDGPSKRKTILQIAKSTTNSTHAGSPSHAGAAAKPKATHNPLGLLANYGDSDDEGADEDAPTPPRPTKGGFIGMDGTKPENEMDTKVADFLAEIDALDPEDADEHPSEPNGAPVQQEPAPVAEAPPPPPAPIDNGGWQELLDENTNCIYYWNTETNAVTWETPEGFQPVDATEPAPPPPEPEETPTPTQPQEPILELEEPAPQPIIEELKVKPEPKKVVKEETKKEVLKMVPVAVKIAQKKAPELDMFADEVKNEEAKKEASNKASKVMPVYGTLKVDYDIEEDEEDGEEEEEEEEVAPPTKKLGAYSMFVKGDTMPSSRDGDDISSKKSSESKMQLSHYDVAFDEDEEDDDAMDSRTNGDAESEEEEDDDVVEMDAADELDIDQQLELALERKKAELAHLEDMEKGGSSPGQMKRRMSSPLNIYDEKGEVNLLSFKKKRLENLKGQKQVQTCDQGTQCDKELDKVAAEDDKYQSAKKIKDETKLKKELSELGSILTGKLEFLGQSRKGLSKLQILLVELETRILDWREGALDGKHLLRKLQLADWELQKNEAEAVPPGWTCTWNRTYKQYYYTNSDTEESQWDYPTDALTAKEEDKWEQNKRQRLNSAMFNRASSQDDSHARARGSTSMMHGSVISEQLTSIIAAAPSPPPAPSESIPPPPGPPNNGPPGPPNNAPPLPNDPPPPGTGPDLPPLPPSPPPMPPSPPAPPDDSDSDDSEGPSSRPLTPPPLPPSVPPFAAVTLAGPPPPPELDDGTVIGAPQILYTNAPIMAGATINRPPDVSGLDGTPVGDYGGAPVPYGGQAGSGEPSGAGQPTVTKVKKTKKKVKKSAVKKKMPSSLVEKWKQIQEAQIKEEEEKRRREEEEDMVIDPSVIQQKRIADWKKQQMEKGVTAHNPNFEMIHGDWRERLKRKGPK